MRHPWAPMGFPGPPAGAPWEPLGIHWAHDYATRGPCSLIGGTPTNNYPWPNQISDKNKKSVEEKAQKVLDIRSEFNNNSLAELYDPVTMHPKLVKAHQDLDKAVDLCYRPQAFKNESNRIEFLFGLYEQYISIGI